VFFKNLGIHGHQFTDCTSSRSNYFAFVRPAHFVMDGQNGAGAGNYSPTPQSRTLNSSSLGFAL